MPRPEDVVGALLKKVPLFAALSDGEVHELATIGTIRRMRRDEIVFVQGDTAEHFFVILEGRVKIFLQDPLGREVILSLLGRESFFGEMSLIDGQARSACAQAMQETRAFSITQDDFGRFLERNPQVSRKLLRHLCARVRQADAVIESMALLSVKGRLARLLAEWAEKDGRSVDGDTIFRLAMPKTQMAQMLGTSRESVSRMISGLRDEGVIALEGNLVRVRDLERLRRIR